MQKHFLHWTFSPMWIIGILILLLILFFICQTVFYQPPILNDIRKRLEFLNPLYGTIPLREGYSSYTENKSVIYICLKDQNGKYYDMNTLMYVTLHELAHVLSNNYGHGQEFKDNFNNLLKYAEIKGVYNKYIPMPNMYCGIIAT